MSKSTTELTDPPDKAELSLPADQNAAMLAIISRAASDPSVDTAKMRELLDMKERIDAETARRAFTEALHGFQSECPQIHRSGGIVVNNQLRSRYAPFEETMKVVQPVMQKYGFSATFDTDTDERGVICSVTCTLSHIGGHSVPSKFPVMPDSSGSKNSIQAIGSALSYGKRYSLGAVLGLVFTNEDDDGRATSAINDAKNAVAIKPKGRREEAVTVQAEIVPDDAAADRREKDIATIRGMLADDEMSDDDLTVYLNLAIDADLPDWTDATDRQLSRLATRQGFDNLTKKSR